MRRAEFDVKDTKLLEELLSTCEYGTLSLVDGDTLMVCRLILPGMKRAFAFMVQKKAVRWSSFLKIPKHP